MHHQSLYSREAAAGPKKWKKIGSKAAVTCNSKADAQIPKRGKMKFLEGEGVKVKIVSSVSF